MGCALLVSVCSRTEGSCERSYSGDDRRVVCEHPGATGGDGRAHCGGDHPRGRGEAEKPRGETRALSTPESASGRVCLGTLVLW